MDLSSTELFPQIVLSIAIAAAVFFLMMVVETMYKAYLGYGQARVAVYPVTGNRSVKIEQNPANPSSITLPLSENQLTGIEFSYSFFLYISDKNEGDTEGWRTVFYKGYESSPFPLLGPGVFVSASNATTGTPTLRVIMNTYDNWFNPIDVTQIPYNKWIHVALVLRKNTMEIYINGNLANKKKFAGTLPYQNYSPLNLFPSVKTNPPQEWSSSSQQNMKKNLPLGENFIVLGEASGYLSNIYYFSYAMSYSEIQSMMSLGPSSQFDEMNMDKPPYLIDSWWVGRKQ